jgi:prevent-host-death family protein
VIVHFVKYSNKYVIMYVTAANRKRLPTTITQGEAMPNIRLDTDLQPVTEFRANAAALIAKVRESKRPVVLTQHGRGAVVIVDVEEYQKMLDNSGSAQRETLPAPAAAVPPAASASVAAANTVYTDPLVDAYKGGIDRSLIRANLHRPIDERLRRLTELGEFREALRSAPRRRALSPDVAAERPPDPATS